MPQGRYTTVIDRLRPGAAAAGEIVHLDGRVLGRHDGVTRYTVGQRRGLDVAVGEPLFVVRLDADRRQVIVGPREALLDRRCTLKETNWLGDEPSIEDAARAARPCSRACARPGRRRRRGCALGGRRGVVGSTRPRRRSRPARPACSTTRPSPSRVLGGGFIARD